MTITFSPDLHLAALNYFKMGYMTIPLGLDPNGYPKRPLPTAWSQLPRSLDALQKLPWDHAVGIGVLLGPVSGNLSAIDVDDITLADAVIPKCLHTRLVRTVRGRCHIYVREQHPSPSRKLEVIWQERTITVELKGAGTQVAAPPTPGYTVLSEAEPKLVPSTAAAWQGIAKAMNIQNAANENYPKPWRQTVPTSERNKSAYMEAHCLREANMPLDLALRIMQLRWEADYEKGEQPWEEVARTIESAYGKGQHAPLTEVFKADVEWN